MWHNESWRISDCEFEPTDENYNEWHLHDDIYNFEIVMS